MPGHRYGAVVRLIQASELRPAAVGVVGRHDVDLDGSGGLDGQGIGHGAVEGLAADDEDLVDAENRGCRAHGMVELGRVHPDASSWRRNAAYVSARSRPVRTPANGVTCRSSRACGRGSTRVSTMSGTG